MTAESKPLRVAMAFLSGGGLSGGARKTLAALAPRLAAHPRIAALTLLLPPAAAELPELAGLDVRILPDGPALLGRSGAPLLHDLAPDVVFVPNAAHPGRCDAPVVVMARNVEPIVAPFGRNPLGAAMRNVARALRARRACQKADRVIAVSGYVRSLLVDRWSLPEQRIGVVYHGVDPAEFARPEDRPENLPAESNDRFWFSAGSLVPYRALEDAVDALARRVREGADEHLIHAGPDVYSPAYRKRILQRAIRLGVGPRVHCIGSLGREELDWCYANCLGLLMTSRLEACPNVALEAMSAGCEILATHSPPMPEILGDTAVYYPPGQADALAGRMNEIRAAAPVALDRRRELRLARAAVFSWDRCCEATVEQLALAAG